MAITFQHADEALNQNSTVIGTLSGIPALTSTAEDIDRLLNELFEGEVNDRFLKTKVKYLSGGQKQKLNLVRSLLLDTSILILDEPLNGLDFDNIVRVLSMLKEKQKAGKGILLISHNEEIFDAIVPEESVYYLHAIPMLSHGDNVYQ
jgi:ABC-type multidrug transport system ATPase subunit